MRTLEVGSSFDDRGVSHYNSTAMVNLLHQSKFDQNKNHSKRRVLLFFSLAKLNYLNNEATFLTKMLNLNH